jgi:hypothetical protein
MTTIWTAESVREASRALVDRIRSIDIPSVTVQDIAPETYHEFRNNPLIVWSGASDHTIFNVTSHNHIHRAHHDSVHLRHRLDFSIEREIEATRIGIAELRLDGALADLYYADNGGQTEHYRDHGCFPSDQISFVTKYLNEKG